VTFTGPGVLKTAAVAPQGAWPLAKEEETVKAKTLPVKREMNTSSIGASVNAYTDSLPGPLTSPTQLPAPSPPTLHVLDAKQFTVPMNQEEVLTGKTLPSKAPPVLHTQQYVHEETLTVAKGRDTSSTRASAEAHTYPLPPGPQTPVAPVPLTLHALSSARQFVSPSSSTGDGATRTLTPDPMRIVRKIGQVEIIHPAMAASDALKCATKKGRSEHNEKREALVMRGFSPRLPRPSHFNIPAKKVWSPETAVANERRTGEEMAKKSEEGSDKGVKVGAGEGEELYGAHTEEWNEGEEYDEWNEQEGEELVEEEDERESGQDSESLVKLLYSEIDDNTASPEYGENSIMIAPAGKEDLEKAGEFRGEYHGNRKEKE
jgi:hypothetical protein